MPEVFSEENKKYHKQKDKYTLGSFKQILTGVKYSHLPIYKKQQRSWINVNDRYEISN